MLPDHCTHLDHTYGHVLHILCLNDTHVKPSFRKHTPQPPKGVEAGLVGQPLLPLHSRLTTDHPRGSGYYVRDEGWSSPPPLSSQDTISGHHQASLLLLTLPTGVIILIEAFISTEGYRPPEEMGQPIHTGVASAPWKAIGFEIVPLIPTRIMTESTTMVVGKGSPVQREYVGGGLATVPL